MLHRNQRPRRFFTRAQISRPLFRRPRDSERLQRLVVPAHGASAENEREELLPLYGLDEVMRRMGLSIFLLFPLSAGAAIDLTKPPLAFCEPPLSVSDRTADCDHNDTFTTAAKACFARLNQLEAELGKEAHAVARQGELSQLSKTNTGGKEYAFSEAALIYLQAVASTALRELKEYSNVVAMPALDDAPSSVADLKHGGWGASCFSEAQRGLEKTRTEFSAKLSRYAARIAESRKYQATLRANATNFGALSGETSPALKQMGKGSGNLPAKPAAGKDSWISGVEEDAAARAKSPLSK